MNCKISCSFGEIIDKKTILCIKKNKIKDKNVLKKIILELTTICNENPLVNNDDILFTQLYNINNKLWVLEDLIREKSLNKQFDEKYIEYAENIHKTNDERYKIKKQINLKYNSLLVEEKFYTNKNLEINNQNLNKLSNIESKEDLNINKLDIITI